MYTVVLVDDERIELETLKHYMPWEEMGFQVVDTAKNGKEALDKIGKWHPDLVITDVKMPMMDGVAFASLARARMPRLKIVFLSGYDDFAYVKSALQVEASGYLLKPPNRDELRQLMLRIREKCDDELRAGQSGQALAKQYMMDLLQERDEQAQSRLAHDIRSLKTDALCSPAGTFSACLITIDEYLLLTKYVQDGAAILASVHLALDRLSKDSKALAVKVSDREYLVAGVRVPPADLLEWQAQLAGYRQWITICPASEETTLEALPDVYRRLRQRRDRHVFLYGTGHFVVTELRETDSPSHPSPLPGRAPSAELLHGHIQHGRKAEADHWLREFYAWQAGTEGEGAGAEGVLRASFELLDALYVTHVAASKAVKDRVEDRTSLFNKLTVIESIPWIELTVRQFAGELTEAIGRLQEDPHNPAVRQLQALIAREYAKPLTIEYLADHVFMSPNYLSTIFKEHTGKTVLAYVTQVRMERAADLLREGSLKIHEISAKVGYENASHFCSVFQKKNGITPNQYRNQMLKR